MTDTARVGTGAVEVTRVTDEHLGALAGFYAAVWDPNATADRVRVSRHNAGIANPVTPGEPPPTWIVLREQRAIGHVTTIPIRLWIDGQERPAYWIKGLWVLPEFQRSAVGFLVLRAAAQELESVAALALAHDPAAVRLFGALGFQDLGGLPNDLRILNARRVLSRLDPAALPLGALARSRGLRLAMRAAAIGGVVGDLTTATWAALASGTLGSFDVASSPECDARGLEDLWLAARDEVRASPRRGGAEFVARYGGGEYAFVQVRDGRRLAALGVVKRPSAEGDPRLRGIRVATLADVLFRPSEPRAGLAVLRGAERVATEWEADALLCGASVGAVRGLLRRRGFFRAPPNLHVLARVPGSAATLEHWWITRGDSGGDGSF